MKSYTLFCMALIVPCISYAQQDNFTMKIDVASGDNSRIITWDAGELALIYDNVYPAHNGWVGYLLDEAYNNVNVSLPGRADYEDNGQQLSIKYDATDVLSVQLDFEVENLDDKIHLKIPNYKIAFDHNEAKDLSESVVIDNPKCAEPFDLISDHAAYSFRLRVDLPHDQLKDILLSRNRIINELEKGTLENTYDVDTDQWVGNYNLTKEEQQSLLNAVDTIITYNPDTFEEIIKVNTRTIDENDISNYRLWISLYYDNRCGGLRGRLDGYSPLVEFKEDGEVLFEMAFVVVRNLDK